MNNSIPVPLKLCPQSRRLDCYFPNEDLTEAISLGHDLGHTPFGHSGENVLNRLNPNGFEHNKHSLRVVELLENDGEGLNLTFEVRDGILHHKKSGKPSTLFIKIGNFNIVKQNFIFIFAIFFRLYVWLFNILDADPKKIEKIYVKVLNKQEEEEENTFIDKFFMKDNVLNA